ncbi:restriction endonuclease subunit S [Sinomonas susongensis]|uniref:restriction endonuclease subunit S n=1 Tax=Sinomonas susongensis TaxID=1324851 RepID=UPI001109B739|nr:restriction endonuclease subunit S [Sinomonas susongensis]
MNIGGSIPDGWKVVRASDLCRLQRGFDITEATRVAGSVPVYSSSGISYFHARAAVQPPAVVTGRKGLLGRVFYVDEPFWPHDTTLWADDFNGNDPRFVAAVLAAFHLERLDAATSVPTLNRNNLTAYEVMIPSRRVEQANIAAVILEADTQIEALEKLIAKKRDVKLGMVQELLTGSTRLPGFTGEWRDITLGDHVTYLRTVALSRDQLDQESPLRYLHYGDIHTRSSVRLDAASESMPRAASHLASRAGRLAVGDLVFADASEDPDGVGKSVEVTDVPPEGAVPGLHTIAARFDKSVLADGFKGYIQFIPAFRAALLRLAAGTKVLATTRSYISGIALTLPGADEQRAIAEVLQDVDAEIVAWDRRLEWARAVKVGMMQELLTGRTRLPSKEET